MLSLLLSGGMSLRRAAIVLKVHRKTVERKLLFLGLSCEFKLRAGNLEKQKAVSVQFDDLETFEHTKLKPLSITLAVEEGTRRILGLEVSRMAAKGKLAKKSREKYGRRKDERRAGRERLFKRLAPIVVPEALFKSDSNLHYGRDLKRAFPKAKHVKILGVRGMSTAQGELKKTGFDPIFSLNHTCAMLRANINRLFRRTWCTTKKPENLYAHLMIYAAFHNERLIQQN